MQTWSVSGTRLRERRVALGLRQRRVATLAGISASYLNLIEHDRRKVTEPVLRRLAEALALSPEDLDPGGQAGLLGDLRAAMALGEGAGAEPENPEDFAARFPGWAQLCAEQSGRIGRLERVVATLNDRLSQDPHLAASLHDMLSAVSAVRSTAGILAETPDLDADWRVRFHRNIHADSERLARGAEALVGYLDGSEAREDAGNASPQEEVETWLAARGWALPELEPGGTGKGIVLAEIADLSSHAARHLARAVVDTAAQDAQHLPARAVRAALDLGEALDPVRLAVEAGCDVLVAFRRLALAPGSPAGLVLCDASGTLTFRKPVATFVPPRFGSACALWPLFSALARPQTAIRVEAELGLKGTRALTLFAFGAQHFTGAFDGPDLRSAGMLVLPARGGRAPGMSRPVRQIGTTCRICAVAGCPARREPSILGDDG